MPEFYICPGCGVEVKVGSPGCPKCNNLDPWEIEENGAHDGLDLPDDDFDYDEFVEKEFSDRLPKRGKALFWWITAVILLIAFLFAWVF